MGRHPLANRLQLFGGQTILDHQGAGELTERCRPANSPSGVACPVSDFSLRRKNPSSAALPGRQCHIVGFEATTMR
jgi:hypothetical protein